ncbi:hypothetical protein J2S04_001597 [Alicyclobacillus tengchongensis]|uniref:Class I SAM-dependent methyltransferase n=1 Tax=Alicyclobacillus tolerans TaxID=90970 RepID=A0ABT9LWJ2_9BACL|nr:class I SAM-dependent methyltransferase [Alicyclobacillus tengchongensis]MDP9728647.1 hypothetical protein [Alicyclobacillus tengchongensis]
MDWCFYDGEFVSDRYYNAYQITPAWIGHRWFAYDLVSYCRPRKIVELGTHLGVSFFSFCQAVKDNRLNCECIAIDTWCGDAHSGFYTDEIYKIVEKIANDEFSKITRLMRMKFQEALPLISDESIDILHIDGFHTYEAVKNDFEEWLPKIAPEGIVLFHDITVYENEFGVYQLWDELKKEYPSIEFRHSNGLGVLFPKGNHYFDLMKNQEKFYQKIYLLSEENAQKNEKINQILAQMLTWNQVIEQAKAYIQSHVNV